VLRALPGPRQTLFHQATPEPVRALTRHPICRVQLRLRPTCPPAKPNEPLNQRAARNGPSSFWSPALYRRSSRGRRRTGGLHEPNHLFDRADCGDHAHFVLLRLALARPNGSMSSCASGLPSHAGSPSLYAGFLKPQFVFRG
jgi:hypothetical protein